MGLIFNGQLTVANLGDSIATLVRKDGSWAKLTEEHTPCRAEERKRIENLGGFIFNKRVRGELSVSRAFGNIDLKEWVIGLPEVTTQEITPADDLLILASDGIFRSYSIEYIVQRIQELRLIDQSVSLG